MKSLIYKGMLAAGLLAPAVQAYSLFDAAPIVGVPESYAVRYNAYVNVGVDDNVNSAPRDEESGGFVRFGVGASYADCESVTKLSYTARVGAQVYNKEAHGTEDSSFTDILISARLTHSLGRGRQYACSLGFTYTPEVDYTDSYSRDRSYGERMNWYLNNTYSHPIDERWSGFISLAYSGDVSFDDNFDDRQYLTVGTGLNYKASERTTYGVSTRYRYEFREIGMESESIYLNANVTHALSPISSLNLSLGTQYKIVDGTGDLYPDVSFSYNRALAEGMSASAYLTYSNENVMSSWKQNRDNYRSVETLRLGVRLNYAYTHRVSFHCGAAVNRSDYSEAINGTEGYERLCWSANAGMRYKVTDSTALNLNYTYYSGDTYGDEDYQRNVVSAGVDYTF